MKTTIRATLCQKKEAVDTSNLGRLRENVLLDRLSLNFYQGQIIVVSEMNNGNIGVTDSVSEIKCVED